MTTLRPATKTEIIQNKHSSNKRQKRLDNDDSEQRQDDDDDEQANKSNSFSSDDLDNLDGQKKHSSTSPYSRKGIKRRKLFLDDNKNDKNDNKLNNNNNNSNSTMTTTTSTTTPPATTTTISTFLSFHLDLLRALYNSKNADKDDDDDDVDDETWSLIEMFLEEKDNLQKGKKQTTFLKNVHEKSVEFQKQQQQQQHAAMVNNNNATTTNSLMVHKSIRNYYKNNNKHHNNNNSHSNKEGKKSLLLLSQTTTTTTTPMMMHHHHPNQRHGTAAFASPRYSRYGARTVTASPSPLTMPTPLLANNNNGMTARSSCFSLVTHLLQKKLETFHSQVQQKSQPYRPLLQDVTERLDKLKSVIAVYQNQQWKQNQTKMIRLLTPPGGEEEETTTTTTTIKSNNNRQPLHNHNNNNQQRIETKIKLWEMLLTDLQREIY